MLDIHECSNNEIQKHPGTRIKYPGSSIGPENATASNIPAMPVEMILCNVRAQPEGTTHAPALLKSYPRST